MFPSRPAHRVRPYRPRFEILEARHLLSTYVVDNLGDGGSGSGLAGDLRYCINQAADGDAITFGVTGTINLTGALPDLTHSISIDGPGASLMTVRRDTGGNYRIFTVDGGPTVSICGLTITNGYVTGQFDVYGGGIENAGTLTVSNCTISGNQVSSDPSYYSYVYGGGIANFGTLTLSNSTVAGNRAVGLSGFDDGGGIANFGTLALCNSTVAGNGVGGINMFDFDAGYGGGIANFGILTLSNSTVAGNGAYGYGVAAGGGIYNQNDLTVRSSTIAGNRALFENFDRQGGSGGGIDNKGGTVTISNSTVAGNDAGVGDVGDGGGIYNDMDGTLTLNNATVSGNSDGDGYGGGGIYNDMSATLHSGNSIIAGNTGYGGYSDDLDGDLGSLGHNLIGDGTAGSGFDPTDLVGTYDSPIDPLLGPLQDNGGPTPTMALLAGSPALDAGDPGQLGVADQRGVPRTGGVNIGAYQASATAFVLSAPDTVDPGTPFDLTVAAVDPFGQPAYGYTGTVTFSTSDGDPNVVLPADYPFTPADQGTHTFSGGVTLITPGDQTITATDTSAATVAGSATVTVIGGQYRAAAGIDARAAAAAPAGDRRAADAGWALAAGSFEDPDQVAHLKQDTDLAPLGPREDFRQFGAELAAAMPEE
jgi:hypothetical protein